MLASDEQSDRARYGTRKLPKLADNEAGQPQYDWSTTHPMV